MLTSACSPSRSRQSSSARSISQETFANVTVDFPCSFTKTLRAATAPPFIGGVRRGRAGQRSVVETERRPGLAMLALSACSCDRMASRCRVRQRPLARADRAECAGGRPGRRYREDRRPEVGERSSTSRANSLSVLNIDRPVDFRTDVPGRSKLRAQKPDFLPIC